MRKIMVLLCGVLIACLCCGIAAAAEEGSDSYGYTADDVAVNQGIVAYWYAYGYANAWGNLPDTYAEVLDSKIAPRDWVSPHNGNAINPDDGSLDFDGDFMYHDGMVTVKTSAGEVSLPGSVTATSDISVQWDGSCCFDMCGECCYVGECDWDCWNVCSNEDAACKVVQWMMWKSFELHECMFGQRPSSVEAFMASGLSPVGPAYKEWYPNMSIEWGYAGGDCCCYVKKAHVDCCKPCGCKSKCGCETKSKCNTKCGGCNKCTQKTCTKCDSGDKCGCKTKCKSDCKKSCCKQNTCTKCNSGDKCGCKTKCKSDCKKSCCKQKTCTKCNSGDKCGCKTKCKSDCKKSCCKQKTCTKCNSGDKCGCKTKCKSDCKKSCCKQKTCTKCDSGCNNKCKSKCSSC